MILLLGWLDFFAEESELGFLVGCGHFVVSCLFVVFELMLENGC